MVKKFRVGQKVVARNVHECDIPKRYEGKTARITEILGDNADDPEDRDIFIIFDGDEDDDIYWIHLENIKMIGNILNL